MRLRLLLIGFVILTLLLSIGPPQAHAQGGNYIVADPGAQTLWMIPPPAGSPVAIYSGAPFVMPRAVAIDAAGNYIVTDPNANTLWRVPPPAGPPVAIYSGAPFAPDGVAIDAAGNYIVTDPNAKTLWMVPPAGSPVAIYTGAPFVAPVGVAIGPPAPPPVGGTVLPVDKLVVAAPLIVLVVLGSAVAGIVIRMRKPET